MTVNRNVKVAGGTTKSKLGYKDEDLILSPYVTKKSKKKSIRRSEKQDRKY